MSSGANAEAPLRPLPKEPVYAVEYPGYVASTSVPLAVTRLGGQSALDGLFRDMNNEQPMIELKLRPDNPFAHPASGDVAGTNKIVLKVTKRRRKRREDGMDVDGAPKEELGEFMAEAVGTIMRTVRFRSESSWCLWARVYGYPK